MEDTSGMTVIKIPKTKIKTGTLITIPTIGIIGEKASGLVTVLVVRKTEMQSLDIANVTVAVTAAEMVIEMTLVMKIMNPIK
jgi:hypothetical protein